MQKNLNKVTTTMNKTFTAAIAIAATAGLAFAAIETAPAGYEEKTAAETATLVCNPFLSFDTSASTPKLGDIDGSNLANGDYIGIVSAGGQIAKYYWHDNAWYTAASGGDPANSVALTRGDAIQFSATAGRKLLLSGLFTEDDVAAKTASVGYNLVGNVSASSKTLADFTVTGTDPNKDYVNLRGTKYVYENSHWVTREGRVRSDSVSVAPGEGLFLYCANRGRGKTLSATITVPCD